MRKAVLATITILLLSGMAQAQEAGTPAPPPSPLRLTLNDAIERALATAPRMDQLRAIERAAQADVDGALALRWPSIETQAGYTRNSNVPELILNLPGSAPRTLFPNIPDNLRARLNASLTLYSGGRIDGLVTAARREADAQAHDARTERQDLALETRAAYWSLASARAMAVVYREGIDAYESHLKDARNRERVGLAARNEVMAVTVERDRALLARLKADNLIRLTEANLGRLLSLAPGATIEIVDPLEVVMSQRVRFDLERGVRTALETRSEYTALAARIQAASARLQIERAARLPQVQAVAGLDYANPNRKILPPTAAWKESWDASVQLAWPVFDGGKATAGEARARARQDALRAQQRDMEQRIRLQVTERALNLETAEQGVSVASSALAAARESQRVASDRYRAGLLSSSDLLDAEMALLRAGLEQQEAWIALHLAHAQLDRALGR